MLSDFLSDHITSQAAFVEYGYGQVEPNHLSAQRTAQVYAQLPADKNISVLEQGQFVKYDYANGLVNFTGEGEWMLVFNEIKLYREGQLDCEFAMIKDNYQARVYSPVAADTNWDAQSRYYNGVDAAGNSSYTFAAKYAKTADTAITSGKTYYTLADGVYTAVESPVVDNIANYYEQTKAAVTYAFDDVTAAADMYELHYNVNPFHIESQVHEKMMPEGTSMVPRVFKTNPGDIYTTNTINESSVAVGDKLYVGDKGLLVKSKKTSANANGAVSGDMVWQVAKVYTMPDHQKGAKLVRIA